MRPCDSLSGQLPFRKFCDHTGHSDDLAVHRRRGSPAEGRDRIPVHIVDHAERAAAAVQITLSAALAVFRISEDGFVCFLIKIKDITGADIYTVPAADAFIKIQPDNAHLAPPFFPPNPDGGGVNPLASGSPGK